jgi:hypothetical protein
VTLPSGERLHLPIRVIANGEDAELLFTLFQTPGMTDEQFVRDARMVEKDLAKLKTLVEEAR